MFKPLRLLLFAVLVVGVSSTALTRVSAARPASAVCTVEVLYEFRDQQGNVLVTELYQKDFVVEEGVDFVDDFSTRTRFKQFTASLQRAGGATVVSINWFADVSVFDSVDFSTQLTLEGGKPGTVSGNQTFSSTPGHAKTTYSLVGVRD